MNKTKQIVSFLRADRISYAAGLELQRIVKEKVQKEIIGDTIILLEHEPVYTVGIRHNGYSEHEEEKLKSLGADFYRVDRGGLITFHGPGQLVAYPIINLRNYQPSVRWYISQLEKTIIEVCKHFGLDGYTSHLTGVWVRDAKICAMGIRASRHFTSHGLALNCNVDLKWFENIVPCGIPDKQVTSLSEQLNKEILVLDVISVFLNAFEKVFNVECKEIKKELIF